MDRGKRKRRGWQQEEREVGRGWGEEKKEGEKEG